MRCCLRKFTGDSKGPQENGEKRKSLTVAFERDISSLNENFFQQVVADEKEKNKLTVCGGISIYLGRFSREECLLETSKALGQNKYDDKRAEKSTDNIALMALRLNEDGRYIGDSLCLSPVVWPIFKLHNDCENTDLLTLLSSENYLNDISELENNLFLETENGAPMTFADAYKITRNQYGKYISENFRQDKYVVVFRLFESAEYMEKFGENDILSLCKSYYATDISMVSEALKQNILKPEMVKYCKHAVKEVRVILTR